MLGAELVRPLEDDWRETLDHVAHGRGWPTSHDVARLGALVAELSAAYNDPLRARASIRDAGPARLGFSFARDVPKAAGAVRELVATRSLGTGGALRVLDVGAGLGATTWGLLRALEASHSPVHHVEAVWVDADRPSLDVGTAVVRARAGKSSISLDVRPHARAVDSLDELGTFDVVLFGQVLSELGVGLTDDERLSSHVALLRRCLEHRLRPGGALVIVEPALRDRTRHLHRVRDALALGVDGFVPFAPCLHAGACPALERETDWCHEDVAVDLPPWLVPVARVAGLRHEGLTFSYLVITPGLAGLREAVHGSPDAARLRVVSDLIRTKGKREVFLCGQFSGERGSESGRVRVMRLDRDASEDNRVFAELVRGDVVTLTPSPSLERPRVASQTRVVRVAVGKHPSHGETR